MSAPTAIECAGCDRLVNDRTGEPVKRTKEVRIVGADFCPNCRAASSERVLAEISAYREAWAKDAAVSRAEHEAEDRRREIDKVFGVKS